MTATDAAPAAQSTPPEALLRALRDVRSMLAATQPVVTGQAMRALDEAALLEVQHHLAGVRRDADLMLAAACAEVGRRSTPDLGAGGLARKQGHNDPAGMLAAATGGSRRDADKLIQAGRAMADVEEDREAQATALVDGAPAPEPERPTYPLVADAMRAGRISVDAGAAITRMLDSVRGKAPTERIARAERRLVDKAPGLTLEKLAPVIRRYHATLVAHEAQARQERLHDERYLIFSENNDGSVELRGKLDPASAAPVRAAFEGMVKGAFQRRREQDPLAPDQRTAGQIRADALVTFARHMMGCDAAPTAHATTKVVVRIGLDQLRRGAGVAEIDGATATIPASRLRQMAVDAEYIPVVLGGSSEPLDVGRARREFTAAQRTALLERDGGCAMCGAPPSHCEAHHIEWWDRDGGRTDLANGVMLCVSCHHTVHRQRWEIDASPHDVWFRPPPQVDARRRPRLGGRARFGLTYRDREELLAVGASGYGESDPPGDPSDPPSQP